MFRMTVRYKNAIIETIERDSLLSIEKLIKIKANNLQEITGADIVKIDRNNNTIGVYSINLMII